MPMRDIHNVSFSITRPGVQPSIGGVNAQRINPLTPTLFPARRSLRARAREPTHERLHHPGRLWLAFSGWRW